MNARLLQRVRPTEQAEVLVGGSVTGSCRGCFAGLRINITFLEEIQ